MTRVVVGNWDPNLNIYNLEYDEDDGYCYDDSDVWSKDNFYDHYGIDIYD